MVRIDFDDKRYCAGMTCTYYALLDFSANACLLSEIWEKRRALRSEWHKTEMQLERVIPDLHHDRFAIIAKQTQEMWNSDYYVLPARRVIRSNLTHIGTFPLHSSSSISSCVSWVVPKCFLLGWAAAIDGKDDEEATRKNLQDPLKLSQQIEKAWLALLPQQQSSRAVSTVSPRLCNSAQPMVENLAR